MNYLQAQDYLNSFINYERVNLFPYKSSFKLKRIQQLLSDLGNPQGDLRIIHIAGTKGKGSTCAFCAAILNAAGLKVGLYTSPHLIEVRERVRILGGPETGPGELEKEYISKEDFTSTLEKIKPFTERLRDTELGRLSYYEILTACAFLYFKEQQCDIVVLETGVGGRLDATNVAASLVAAITPISYEHMRVLGSTLAEIAAEKAGIIKDRPQIALTAPQRPQALKAIRQRAQQTGINLIEIGKDLQIKHRAFGLNGQTFDLQGIFGQDLGLKIKLLGEHQVINAAIAVGCVKALRFYGIQVSGSAIRQGLLQAVWPGRMQIISRRPMIIVDAAHNRASAHVLKQAIMKFFKRPKPILILGVSRDKDVRGILKELAPFSARIILTKSQNPRALEPELISPYVKKDAKQLALTENLTQALQLAQRIARKTDLVLICGSVFLAGEALCWKGARK